MLYLYHSGYMKQTNLQLKSDSDVSGIPLPYRILRQWLLAPGSIDGYTFYRQSQKKDDRDQERSFGKLVTATVAVTHVFPMLSLFDIQSIYYFFLPRR